MKIKLIILLRGELVGIVEPQGQAWPMAMAAAKAGFEVYRTHFNSPAIAVIGEYGWRMQPNPPGVVRLAVMINN